MMYIGDIFINKTDVFNYKNIILKTNKINCTYFCIDTMKELWFIDNGFTLKQCLELYEKI
jgi:hypothetical protein